MTGLKEDADQARAMISEEQNIATREEKLAACIGRIERIYPSTPQKARSGNVMVHEVPFNYKSYLCKLSPEESIYIVVSLGVRDWQDSKPGMYGDAWVRTEFFTAHPADDDKPVVSREFILGRYQVGIKHNDEFVTLRTSNAPIDEHLEYIDEAIGLVARSLHLDRASSTPGVE